MVYVWCGVVCVFLFAQAACYSKREPNIKEYWEKESSTTRALSLERRLKHKRLKTADDAFPLAVPKFPRGGMGAWSAPRALSVMGPQPF